jgi:hypothetical protein
LKSDVRAQYLLWGLSVNQLADNAVRASKGFSCTVV